ncbi:NDMA-dependent alcohol dehydrogenase [Actinomycetospora endophytica]|uniref:NDMA-dependent alcohol dehydrogenase n=1 Tax=Actinomycetospora endophytica TaxID=2291215 RepID=A0ABS8PHC6_9PSEU|nr:NDMA-dependent alcohol dehydrogenase [Actinomycetospora endophytica]MCD2197669.1 NDMA-dependent alcohol dehydrogenase [Actinomycetospora endophytica]
MQTRGAVIRKAPGELEVVDLELDETRRDEVQVRMVASGLCHSDDHHVTGDLPVGTYPFALGHEGAGVVTEVFENDKGIREGDHVVFSAIPSCGHCRFCSTGRQNLCDLAKGILAGPRWSDGTYRLRLSEDGSPVGQMCGISTFTATTTVSLASVIKIEEDIPLDKACLIGCAVSTGWGSAVKAAEVQPGDTVIVMGAGGIGVSAIQGAVHGGAGTIIAADPVALKREKAVEFGATHTAGSIEEATELARQMTDGQGADATIVTVGVLRPEHIGQALSSVRRAGTVVVTAVGQHAVSDTPMELFDLTLSQKRLQGALFGSTNGGWDVHRLLNLYRAGKLKLDEMITRTYALDEIAQGYRDLHAGLNVRGVVRYE